MGIFKRKAKNEPVLNEQPSMSEKVGDSNIEKGMPDVESPQGASNMKKVGLFLGLLFATGMIVAGLLVFTSDDDTAKDKQKSDIELVETTQSHDFNQDKSAIKEQEELELVAASEVQTASEPQDVPPIQTTEHAAEPQVQAQMVEAEPKEKPINPRLLGDVIVSDNDNASMATSDSDTGSDSQGNSPFMATAGASPSDTFADDGDSQENTFSSSLKPTLTPSVKAIQRGNMDYVLPKGTNILCTLDTQIITTRSGFTRCIITRDIYSANGKVLLLEKGSRIIGEQTSALLHGQARVGILWNEVTTPKGVTVQLASPAAGQLGAAGVGARVKYHFWQRFGGAIMISLIGDLGDSYTNRQNSGDGQRISFENSSQSAQDMATEALKNSINIPPTAYINHGTLINIMVARDVDFSGVYERVNPYEMF